MNDMPLGLIFLIGGAILAFIALVILLSRSESDAPFPLGCLGIIAILASGPIFVIGNRESEKKEFKIIKVDSTHVYKLNESGDSLIIENR